MDRQDLTDEQLIWVMSRPFRYRRRLAALSAEARRHDMHRLLGEAISRAEAMVPPAGEAQLAAEPAQVMQPPPALPEPEPARWRRWLRRPSWR